MSEWMVFCIKEVAHEDQVALLGLFTLQGRLQWDPAKKTPGQVKIHSPEIQGYNSIIYNSTIFLAYFSQDFKHHSFIVIAAQAALGLHILDQFFCFVINRFSRASP